MRALFGSVGAPLAVVLAAPRECFPRDVVLRVLPEMARYWAVHDLAFKIDRAEATRLRAAGDGWAPARALDTVAPPPATHSVFRV